MKTRKRGFLRTMVSALAIFMALTLAAPAALAKGYELDNFAGPDNLIYGGKFYSEFSSLDEVFFSSQEAQRRSRCRRHCAAEEQWHPAPGSPHR